MIEVEKKFQPTKGQLESLLKDAEFLGEQSNVDTYYDTPSFSFLKKKMRLRHRNKDFELKVDAKGMGDKMERSEEITEEKAILKRLGFDENANLSDLVEKELKVLVRIETLRKKYKKDDFTIDVDETDIGYNVCEIELLVQSTDEVEKADERILNLARKYNFEIKKLPLKHAEYLRIRRPEVYKEIFENRERN